MSLFRETRLPSVGERVAAGLITSAITYIDERPLAGTGPRRQACRRHGAGPAISSGRAGCTSSPFSRRPRNSTDRRSTGQHHRHGQQEHGREQQEMIVAAATGTFRRKPSPHSTSVKIPGRSRARAIQRQNPTTESHRKSGVRDRGQAAATRVANTGQLPSSSDAALKEPPNDAREFGVGKLVSLGQPGPDSGGARPLGQPRRRSSTRPCRGPRHARPAWETSGSRNRYPVKGIQPRFTTMPATSNWPQQQQHPRIPAVPDASGCRAGIAVRGARSAARRTWPTREKRGASSRPWLPRRISALRRYSATPIVAARRAAIASDPGSRKTRASRGDQEGGKVTSASIEHPAKAKRAACGRRRGVHPTDVIKILIVVTLFAIVISGSAFFAPTAPGQGRSQENGPGTDHQGRVISRPVHSVEAGPYNGPTTPHGVGK